jgi:integrase
MAVMREAGQGAPGIRLRTLIVVLWRAGLRTSEALALAEGDLEPGRGAMLVRRGKGGRRREVGMAEWGWQQLRAWLEHRAELPVGPLFCVLSGTDRRAAVVGALGPHAVPTSGGEGRGEAALRPAPAPPRPRRGDGARGCLAERDPAPAGPRQPRHHLRLARGDRRGRDHRDRARKKCAAGPGGDGARTVGRPTSGRRAMRGRRLLVTRRGSRLAFSTASRECR